MSKNPDNDLWLDFINDEDEPQTFKQSATDGTEWQGAFDRRKEPRTNESDGPKKDETE